VLLVPSSAPLIGMLMFGNLIKESGVVQDVNVQKDQKVAAGSVLFVLSLAMWDYLIEFLESTGIAAFFEQGGWASILMILVSLGMLYLAIVRKFEPYLLIPIGFGMLLSNLPSSELFVKTVNDLTGETSYSGLLGYLYYGVKWGIYPSLIFLGIGATTDFGPLIAYPKSMLLGAAAQIGIFITFLGALLFGFSGAEAASIGIIGGADGPTAILLTSKLAPELLGPISLAAYSYMALVPIIQPPIIRLLTTKKERLIRMTQLRTVSKKERILFPIVTTLVCVLLVPSSAPLIGMLMFGNLIKESGVVPNLVQTAGNALLYLVTILLGLSVGATATAETFLKVETLFIVALGLFAFATATAAGVLGG
jgi:oxaloacetate decarboxylase beta subunit